jgi:hypothetical protein
MAQNYPRQVSRSRPYQKNDNRFVEENNHSLIRAYIGHDRLDTQAQLKVLRKLYEKLRLYHNFFQPVMRLQEKEYVSPIQYRRKYDQTKTLFDCLKELHILSECVQLQLDTPRKKINPMALHVEIDTLICHLLSLPCLDQSETVNVFKTMI